MNAYKEAINHKINDAIQRKKDAEETITKCDLVIGMLDLILSGAKSREGIAAIAEKIHPKPPKPRIGKTIKLTDIQCGEWVDHPILRGLKVTLNRPNNGTIIGYYINNKLDSYCNLSDLSVGLDVVVIEDPTKDKEEPEESRIGKVIPFEDLEDGDWFVGHVLESFVQRFQSLDREYVDIFDIKNGKFRGQFPRDNLMGKAFIVIAKPDWVKE